MAIKAAEYAALREWFAHIFDNHISAGLNVSLESHPIAGLDAIAEKYPARARQGLEMAINDTIEMTQCWSAERVHAVDRDLEDNGLPTLSEMRARFSKAVGRVLKRGKINSHVEYHAARNAIEFSEPVDRPRLSALIADYELARS